MLPFLARRLIVAALVALAVSAVAFGLMFVSGDPAVVLAGQAGRAQDVELIRHAYGLDRPIPLLEWEVGGDARAVAAKLLAGKPAIDCNMARADEGVLVFNPMAVSVEQAGEIGRRIAALR